MGTMTTLPDGEQPAAELAQSNVRAIANERIAALQASATSDLDAFRELSKEAIKARDVPAFQQALALGAKPFYYVDPILQLKPPCPELLAILLDAGFDVDGGVQGHRGVILNVAAASGAVEYVKLLLERGADPNVVGPNAEGPHRGQGGWMANSLGPLGAAVEGFMMPPPEEQACRVMEMLIDAGARVAGSGALQVAARQDRVRCARLLLERGADANEAVSSVEQGNSPMQLARDNGHADMVALLLEYGVE